MGIPRKVIRDYRFEPEKALANRNAVIAAQKADKGRCIGTNAGVVIEPYYPREPIPAGDPMSPGGTKITCEELADDVLAKIAAAGGGGTLRVRELDGSPNVTPVEDIIVPNGTMVSVAGSTIRLSFREDVDYAGSFELAPAGPSTGDIPDGKWGWWWDTTNNQLWLVRNRGGTLHYVEATC